MLEFIASPLNPDPDLSPQPMPSGYDLSRVEDLNGQFAPQSRNIQPEILGLTQTLQVNYTHPGHGSLTAGSVQYDDWAEVKDVTAKTVRTKVKALDTPRVKANPD